MHWSSNCNLPACRSWCCAEPVATTRQCAAAPAWGWKAAIRLRVPGAQPGAGNPPLQAVADHAASRNICRGGALASRCQAHQAQSRLVLSLVLSLVQGDPGCLTHTHHTGSCSICRGGAATNRCQGHQAHRLEGVGVLNDTRDTGVKE